MRRIAIAAAKGGTGKTTTAVSLAHALALAGRRVLLVDCDPRRHAALHFGLPAERGLVAWLQGGRARAFEVRSGLRVLDSGGAALARLEMALGESPRGEEQLRRNLEIVDDADYVVLDCAPWFGPIQRSALLAATEVLLPVGADYLGLASAGSALEAIAGLGGKSGAPRLLGLLPTFYDAGLQSARQAEAVLGTEFAGRVLQTRVRNCDSLRSAPAQRGTVFDSDPMSPGALDYATLAAEIERLAA